LAKKSTKLQERNNQIRRRIAFGESPQAVADFYKLKVGTIHAINQRYEGSGYEADELHYSSSVFQKAILAAGLDIHIRSLADRSFETRKKRKILAAQLEQMWNIYKDSEEGTTAAELSASQIACIANKLAILEAKISFIEMSAQALYRSLCSVENQKNYEGKPKKDKRRKS